MATFVKTLSDLVALLLQALRLSVLLPAAIFVGLNIALVVPVLQNTKLKGWLQQLSASGAETIFVITLIILIGYTLGVLNIPIIRMFEGFPFLGPLDFMRRHHQRRIHYLQRQIAVRHNEAKKASVRAQDANVSEQMRWQAQMEARQAELEANLFRDEMVWTYPHHQTWRTLPFRLGNVIASAEEFPDYMYGFDAVTFWPYLNPILSEQGYATFVEREKATLDFLLNCTILTVLLGFELVYVDFLAIQLGINSVFKLVACTVLAYGAYITSIQAALSWGYTIRVACVLYKDTLRKRLGLAKPDGFYQERLMWKNAAMFFRDHAFAPARTTFDYIEKFKDESKPK